MINDPTILLMILRYQIFWRPHYSLSMPNNEAQLVVIGENEVVMSVLREDEIKQDSECFG